MTLTLTISWEFWSSRAFRPHVSHPDFTKVRFDGRALRVQLLDLFVRFTRSALQRKRLGPGFGGAGR